jgi:putative acetyltransferase
VSGGFRVRPEREGDAGAIAAVVRDAFGREVEAGLVDALREAGVLAVSLVAEGDDGALVGHVALSPVTIVGVDGEGRWLGLAPLAVRPDRQRQGIGAALVLDALAAADARGAGLVVLLGEPAYYARFGFAPAVRHGLAAQWPVPEEAFMARLLAAGGEAPPAGVVRYHAAFDRLV